MSGLAGEGLRERGLDGGEVGCGGGEEVGGGERGRMKGG